MDPEMYVHDDATAITTHFWGISFKNGKIEFDFNDQ